MFTDIVLARKHAFGLAKSLMVVTMVIAVGTRFSVITADDHDQQLVILHEYDPFG